MVQAVKKICAVYRDCATAFSTVRTWFAKFKIVNFDLEDCERYGSR